MDARHAVEIDQPEGSPRLLKLSCTVPGEGAGSWRTYIAAWCDHQNAWVPFMAGLLFRLTADEVKAAGAAAEAREPWEPPEALRTFMEVQVKDIAVLADPTAGPSELREALRMKVEVKALAGAQNPGC